MDALEARLTKCRGGQRSARRLLQKRRRLLLRLEDQRRLGALVNLWGLALVTPLGLWQAWRFDFAAVPTSMWWLLLFYSLAASMGTVWLRMTGLRHVPTSRTGVFTVMLPLAAAAVGIVFLGERLSAAQVAAFALALTGLLLATWPGRSAPTAAAGCTASG